MLCKVAACRITWDLLLPPSFHASFWPKCVSKQHLVYCIFPQQVAFMRKAYPCCFSIWLLTGGVGKFLQAEQELLTRNIKYIRNATPLCTDAIGAISSKSKCLNTFPYGNNICFIIVPNPAGIRR